ncbi:hypothetical protein M747DRAFT_318935 [Aspergillus niger ATCC 13496]|uniref:Contig An07c0010, genomic contig n=3 Tax=Aspergillus niger TaxID=5061 RepID=A2QLY9_ASPNC|nr:uncharacterized protein An07g00190 [Aspergillus niger]RDH15134.1 hypothetical protein M747DRAFT_318935 [Aspergillus niger ATCC 13496]CAK39243.1 unnamed protein product [Aspergillus niger]
MRIPKDDTVPQLPKANSWNGTTVKAKDPYALMRDSNANTRLTAQHYLWKELLGFLVHPDIDTRAADLRVADIATGNGIWLHDFARGKPPSVDLHGFDISLDQVGPKPWLPTNIHMHIWNIFEDVPDEFIGYFDIVHVRLITVVVKNNDPRPILANLRKLLSLSPNSNYIARLTTHCIKDPAATFSGMRLTPLDVQSNRYLGRQRQTLMHSSPSLKDMTRLVRAYFRPSWKYDLTQIMDENGFTGSMLYTYEYGLGNARFWSDVYVSTWKEFAENALKTPEASKKLEHNAMMETLNGASIMVPKLVWVTKKIDGTEQ